MAGSNAAFDPAVFRTAIRNTMLMGIPGASQDKPTFQWSIARDYAIDDPADSPYDWTSAPTSTVVHPDIQVACAVEFSARPAGSQQTIIGEFDTSRVILTLLDEDYALVKGADLVLMGGNTYTIEFVAPPMGLFDVTVYQIYCQARDES